MASKAAIDRLLPTRYYYSFSTFACSGYHQPCLTLPQNLVSRRAYSSFKLPSEPAVQPSVQLTRPSSSAAAAAVSSPSWIDGSHSMAPATAETTPFDTNNNTTSPTISTTPTLNRPLEKVPLQSLLRGLLVQEVMSRPGIADLSTKILRNNMQHLAGNPVSNFVLDKMLYAQFCAGRTQEEVRQTVDGLKKLGYGGAILNYAREADLSASHELAEGDSVHEEHVAQWLNGTLKTIEYAHQGDFVAIKYSGAGDHCVQELATGAAPDPIMEDALHRLCHSAKQRGVGLLVDAEHHAHQHGIDSWTMALMQKYNRNGQLVVYNTYQMYLKESPSTLAAHLQQARDRGFNLGVKLVRGAYIGSDPRHLIHDTKEDTDRAFNDAARMLATQHVGDPTAPTVGLVLASHNKASMDMMRELRREQIKNREPLADVVYAQLMGMADELSLTLMEKNSDIDENARVFKYVVWGTTEECMMYLLRRAEENREAIDRSSSSRRAMWEELRARLFSF